jgi:lactoylglutathione lyase
MNEAATENLMKYKHTMVRVADLDATVGFLVDQFGLKEVGRYDVQAGRYTLAFLAAPGDEAAQIELTHNWDPDPEPMTVGRAFGHLAYGVENIYQTCQGLLDRGVTINRPPRDGYMAFIKTPDGISIELLQEGERLAPQEPWASMPNIGTW